MTLIEHFLNQGGTTDKAKNTVDGISTGEGGYPAFVGKNLHLEQDKLYTAYASVCIYKFPSRDGFWFGFSLDDIEQSIK